MNILLLGGGGREHALAWKIAQSPECTKLFIAPGNAGTRLCGINVPIAVTDFAGIMAFAVQNHIHMVVVGPEDPLVKGINDFFLANKELRGIPLIGPNQQAAQLEGSKDFAKAFMKRHEIPTAPYRTFSRKKLKQACDFLEILSPPYVLKADGLAAGKGVVILDDITEARGEIESMFSGKFGKAGEKVVIEQFLKGIELSVFVITDGKDYCMFPEAKDYKRIGEGDTGPNTGGMGSVSGVSFANKDFMDRVERKIIQPTIAGLRSEGIIYKGFIFFGLIKVGNDPYVIEYNARLGDPETESIIPRLKNDIVGLFNAVVSGTTGRMCLEFDKRHTATVMMVSGGYPGSYEKGKLISGLNEVKDSLVFHAGTKFEPLSQQVFTDGGRVLAVTSYGDTMQEALDQSYSQAEKISFDGVYFRKDIGFDLF
jgi:phosphoribosylamine--glycine ligase